MTYKLAIEIDGNWNNDRNIDCKIKRQKPIEQEPGYKLIRIDPHKKDFDIFKTVNWILRHIKQWAKSSIK